MMDAYHMNPAKQFASRQDFVSSVVEATLAQGWYDDGRHRLEVGPQCRIEVRDLKTEAIVAYSSTKADFDQSLVEFVNDYF